MAKNVTTSSINQYTGIRVVFSQLNPQNIADNTSTLRASVYQRTTGYSSSWSGGSTVNVTVDGQTKGVWVPPWNVSGQSEWHLGNVDFTVSHNSAGGKMRVFHILGIIVSLVKVQVVPFTSIRFHVLVLLEVLVKLKSEQV